VKVVANKILAATVDDAVVFHVDGLAKVGDFISKSHSMDSVTFSWNISESIPKSYSSSFVDRCKHYPCYSYQDEPLVAWTKVIVFKAKKESCVSEVLRIITKINAHDLIDKCINLRFLIWHQIRLEESITTWNCVDISTTII